MFVWATQEPLWLPVDEAGRFPTLTAALRRQGVYAACFVPLTTPRRLLGAMAFTSYRPVVPAEGDVRFLAEVGRLVALAVEATLSRQELERANERLEGERDRLGLLLEVGEAVGSRLDLPGLLRAVAAGFRRLVRPERTALWLPDPTADGSRPRLRATGLEPAGEATRPADEMSVPVDGSPVGEAFRTGRTVRLGADEMAAAGG
jgi:GAF domain-containing protein